MTFGTVALCLPPHHICADIHSDNIPELDDLIQLTSDVVLCTVQHICGVDELVARAPYPQFSLCVAQHYLPPAKKKPHRSSSIILQICRSAKLNVSPLLCITGHRGEVQLVFGSEDHVLGSDLQDGRRLQWSGDGKERQLGRDLCSVFLPMVLPMEKLQSALNVQRLWCKSHQSHLKKN